MSYQPPQPSAYPGYRTPPPPGTNVLAIVSFVSAFFISLVAIITGHIALAQMRRTGERGQGFAIAGLVLGYIGFIFGTLIFVTILAASSGRGSTESEAPFSSQVSLSPSPTLEPVTIVNMEGSSLEDAESRAAADGLKYLVLSSEGSEPQNPADWTVIRQTPKEGTALPGSSVTYIVEKNKVSVPDVKGLTATDARSELEAAGFEVKLGNSSASDDWIAKSTSPKSGSKVTPGATIKLNLKSPAPKGYKSCGEDVYCKFGGEDSTYFTSTQYLNVYAPKGCTSLYVEANLLDANGTIVDYTNDIASNIPEAGMAKLALTTTSDEARSIQITEANCTNF